MFGGAVQENAIWQYPFLNGRLDEVRIYNITLCEEEIQWLYSIDLPYGYYAPQSRQPLYQVLPEYVAQLAYDGWELYQAGKFVGAFNGGHYTNPNTSTQVHDFWSNGKLAKVDRGDDGHFETILCIIENDLVFVGVLGNKGTFIEVGIGYEDLLGKYTSDINCLGVTRVPQS